LNDADNVSISSAADPTPGARDVVVAVQANGLCGTDLHLLAGELPYLNYPLIPGHEAFGVVAETGRFVTSVKIGDLVAIDPNIPCQMCKFCRDGRGNLCSNYEALGVTIDGCCAEFVLVPEQNCYLLPESIDPSVATFVEPLSCAIHGLDRLPRRPGDSYLIYGAGTMGLLIAKLAEGTSPASISVIDPNEERLNIARALGFQAAQSVDELDGPQLWNTVIDCSGNVRAIEDGLTRVNNGGTFQAFGVASVDARVSISPFDIYRREITIIGSMAVLHSFERAIRILTTWKKQDVARLISHELPLDEFLDGVKFFRDGQSSKVVILPNTQSKKVEGKVEVGTVRMGS
jgi:2-desacetyl-2-hydroxyethyl bacteriochlorophyllide A dehydrogenase